MNVTNHVERLERSRGIDNSADVVAGMEIAARFFNIPSFSYTQQYAEKFYKYAYGNTVLTNDEKSVLELFIHSVTWAYGGSNNTNQHFLYPVRRWFAGELFSQSDHSHASNIWDQEADSRMPDLSLLPKALGLVAAYFHQQSAILEKREGPAYFQNTDTFPPAVPVNIVAKRVEKMKAKIEDLLGDTNSVFRAYMEQFFTQTKKEQDVALRG